METQCIQEFIKKNLFSIESRIKLAQSRSPNSSESIRLLAVSKHQDLKKINILQDIFKNRNVLLHLGESYAQELKEKKKELGEGVCFHFIGRIQKNKIRDIVRYSEVIESVDSKEHAILINLEGEQLSRKIKIFVQVNISEDEKKAGFNSDNALNFFTKVLPELKNIEVLGLMTMLKYYEEPESGRKDYAALRRFRDFLMGNEAIRKILKRNMLELSMGLSEDFEIAVEEGATEVRIGTALFGERS
ncbi:MAG: YggS family pyridoxal phosphate-dependent enzyme [SAR324 cluster bacterium]|uniref:Pyridoxal phosphate homeostasis protein n=1 Tax=SAR324 cluster bacterium TaxID=2024889 RepID=A0A7X9FT15_9DELT|nr:YggS family pyridoxal phosphate-dependent enzyme [SAR324 cluster bacterium]